MEVDDPQVHARIPTRTTRDTSSPNIGMRTGLSPSVANRSRNISASDVWLNGRLTTPHVPEGIRFELCRFRSPLLTTSRLISLPPPTEMFQFGGLPIVTDRDLMSQDVPLGYLRIIESLRLPGAYRSLARPSSALEPSHSLTGRT